MNRYFISIIFTATLLASGCAHRLTGTPIAVGEPQRGSAGATGAPTRSKALVGRVVSIADGDTLTVLDSGDTQHRIRLSGIDAPESGQAFGTRSREHLADLVFGKGVRVEYDKRDRYGRTLGKVLIDGRDANLEQIYVMWNTSRANYSHITWIMWTLTNRREGIFHIIKSGMAWHYKFYENEQPPQDRKTYAEAEVEARAAKRGLWVDPNLTPPWDFRRGRRGAATAGDDYKPAEETVVAPPSTPRRGDPPSTRETPRESVGGETREETVYITRTGQKYHREGCQYLRRSRIPVALGSARQRYTPCSVCRPPK